MKTNKKRQFKAQANIEAYTHFVLKGLIGIKGTSISDVVSFILKSWIGENYDLLEKMKLSVKDWRREERE